MVGVLYIAIALESIKYKRNIFPYTKISVEKYR